MDDKKETKYSLSNGKIDDYSHHEFAYFQSQRYWVERTFDDEKNELGMSDYQIRKWIGWSTIRWYLWQACFKDRI